MDQANRFGRRALRLGMVGALVSISATAHAADDPALRAQIRQLTEQLQAVARQSQQQIEALTQQLKAIQADSEERVRRLNEQVQALQQQAPATQALTVTPPGKVPPPNARNVVVTQQPGNLPGISTVPPDTVANVGAPGGVPPVPAAPVSSGADRVKLSISGQIDRALLYGNDGRDSNVRNVDNTISSTRFRIVGEGRATETITGGVNLESEIRPNPSSTTTLTQNLPQPASAAAFTVRQAETYMQNPNWGGVRLGFGSTATYLTNEIDLSGTFVAGYVNVADTGGGFAFRQRGAARVPASPTTFVTSPDGAFGPAVGAVFYYFDGLVRDNRIRYDSPVFEGFQLSGSVVDGGAADIALRYAGEFAGNQLVAGAGFADAVSRKHIPIGAVSGFPGAPANLYGYAGVPTGANGSALNATPAAPNAGDVTANGSKQFNGSASLLLTNGLNLTVAGGYRYTSYLDPLNRRLSPFLIYSKLGYRAKWFDFGNSAFSVDFAQNDQLQFNGDSARAIGLEFVQFIDPLATELFLMGRYLTLDRRFATYEGLTVVAGGARVRF